MKQYLKNLFMALTGADPFREELDRLNEQAEKSAENLSSVQDMYYTVLEAWGREQKMLQESEKRVASLLVLTENLRGRVADKDRLIGELEKELNKR